MTAEIERFSGAKDAAAFGRFCDWLEQVYQAEMRSFIDANFDSPLDLVKPWRDGLALVRLGGFGKLGKKVASFFDDERLQRIFSFQSMYAGLAPYEALAIYAVITYMDSVQGVFVPEGGMHQMAAGLATAVEKAGATIRYGAPVSEILRNADGSVAGVRIGTGDGAEVIHADAVVCNPDLPVAYRTLLDGVEAPRAARNGKYSPSCLLWVAGVKGLPPAEAAHHNIHFGAQWDQAFKALIDDGVRMPDPSILVTLHSLDDPTLAPEGCSSIYALEPTPNLDGKIDWSREGDRITDVAAGAGGEPRIPDRRRRRAGVRPDRLGGDGDGARHTVRPRPHVLPDRPVPAEQRRQAGARAGLHRLVDTAGRRRADGAGVGQARRRAGGRTGQRRITCSMGSGALRPRGGPRLLGARLAARVGQRRPPTPTTHLLPDRPVTLDESYALCREFNKRHGTTYYWSTKVLPRVKQHHVHALYALRPLRRRHRRRDPEPGRARRARRGASSSARRLRRSGSAPISTPATPTIRC